MAEADASGTGPVEEYHKDVVHPRPDVTVQQSQAEEPAATDPDPVPGVEPPSSVTETEQARPDVETATGQRITLLDSEVLKRAFETGSYTLEKGLKVLLNVRYVRPNGTPATTTAFSEVTEEAGIDVGIGVLSPWDEERVQDNTGLAFDGSRVLEEVGVPVNPEGTRLIALQPETEERRLESGKYWNQLVEAYEEQIELERHDAEYGSTRKTRSAKRQLESKIDALKIPVAAVDSRLAKKIMGVRPDILSRRGVRLEDVRRVTVVAATGYIEPLPGVFKGDPSSA